MEVDDVECVNGVDVAEIEAGRDGGFEGECLAGTGDSTSSSGVVVEFDGLRFQNGNGAFLGPSGKGNRSSWRRANWVGLCNAEQFKRSVS